MERALRLLLVMDFNETFEEKENYSGDEVEERMIILDLIGVDTQPFAFLHIVFLAKCFCSMLLIIV